MISTIYYNEDADHYYRDVDGIRLVYEAYETHGKKYCGRLIGWYRPGPVNDEIDEHGLDAVDALRFALMARMMMV